MSDFREYLYRLGNASEHLLDELKLRFRERMGWQTVVHICPYISFGTHDSLFVKGRVMHNREIVVHNDDEFFDNLANMYRRLNSHEIKGARLRATYRESVTEFVSDEDGYFGVPLPFPPSVTPGEGWHYPVIELLESPVPFEGTVSAQAKIMVPSRDAEFGVISDIDDTILKTNATSLLRMAWNTFAHNVHTRMPFHGVSEFYRALQQGISGSVENPFFYVSSSPWNLYDLLTDFLRLHALPEGPVFLKDYGFTHNKLFTEGHQGHKPKKIRKVLDAFPWMKFILIGDSGQKDPEVYSEIVKQYPDRILAIYIRDVTLNERDVEIRKLYEGHAVDMVYVENTYQAACHAVDNGFINARTLNEIRRGNERDVVYEE